VVGEHSIWEASIKQRQVRQDGKEFTFQSGMIALKAVIALKAESFFDERAGHSMENTEVRR
jgi:hypothetical protein